MEISSNSSSKATSRATSKQVKCEGGAENNMCNKNNDVANIHTNHSLDSTLTNSHQAACVLQCNATEQPAINSPYSFAASSILSTIQFDRQNDIKWAILYSGATSHYIINTAPVCKEIPDVSPITVTLPDGTRASSTHECKLALPQLPAAARFGHILPSLASHSLLSVVKLCNAGCHVSFENITCKVRFRGRLLLSGSKYHRTGLWFVPLTKEAQTPLGPQIDTSPQDSTSQQANHVGHDATPHLQPTPGFETAIPMQLQPWQNLRTSSAQDICAQMRDQVEYMTHAQHTSTKAELAEYHHQSLFSPQK